MISLTSVDVVVLAIIFRSWI